MKNWIEKNQPFFRSLKFKIIGAVALLIVVIGLFVGPQFYGYIMAIGVFALFFFFSKQAGNEQILSPKDIQAMEDDIEAMEKEIAIIQQHIKENQGDLDAKLLLHEMEEELEELKQMIPKEK